MTQSIQNSQHLGQLVRTTRKTLNLTQPDLALAAGVGLRFIVELEAGKPTAQLQKVLDVLAALGLDLQINGAPSCNS